MIDRVYTITAIHDGTPLEGVADYAGKPHAYRRQFDEEIDDWSDEYFLSEIDPDLIPLILEQKYIFRRWSEAFRVGDASLDSHPALPADRKRHDECKTILVTEQRSAQWRL